jgi:hypothetical protein
MPRPVLILVALSLGIVAADPAASAPDPRHGRLFISPMGEPFDGLTAWFRQADSNSDGALTLVEMAQDGARFFATLDLNHDGRIDPDEVANYENVVAPFSHVGPTRRNFDTEIQSPDGDEETQRARSAHRAYGEGPQGAGRFGLLNIPEPVAAADTDFNRTVSLDEFKRAAMRRFDLLDSNHDGRLLLSDLVQ